MGGGLMQLAAYGAQDIYLTGNPQITFFKIVYRRHTNFSVECINQTFDGSITASASTTTATISRNGDLITGMHLDVLMQGTLDGGAAGSTYQNWTNNTGHALIDYAEIHIGGQMIDKHYGHFLDAYNELTDHHQNEHSLTNKHSAKNAYLKSRTALPNLRMYVPFKFWFNRHTGLALPLVALQYHDVKLKLATRATTSLINHDGTTDAVHTTAPSIELWVNYVFLDTDERRRFAQQSHEYLIEQMAYSTESTSNKIRLNLNHPVKELIWTVQDATANSSDLTGDSTLNTGGVAATQGNDWFNYHSLAGTTSEVVHGQVSNEAFSTCKILINGHDRFSAKNASYFRTLHPNEVGHKVPEKHVYCYSFALKPEEHQPSGVCNFSRIDTANMIFGSIAGTDANPATINVYAINYNVLRIMSGMGGLAYSN